MRIDLTRCLVLYYNAATKLIVVRSAREQMKLVETSLVFVTECHGEEIRFRVVRVCGMSHEQEIFNPFLTHCC